MTQHAVGYWEWLVEISGMSEAVTSAWSDWPLWSLSAVLVAWIAYVLTRQDTNDLDKIPGPWKDSWPILGNIREMLRPDFHRTLLAYSDTYGGIVRLKVLWVDAIIVTDPKAVAKIMGPLSREGALDKSAVTYGPVNQMVEAHARPNILTSISDAEWKTVRRAVAVSFSQSNIQKKLSVVVDKTNMLISRLHNLDSRNSVDVDQAALRISLDVIGLAAFDRDYNSVSIDNPPPNHLLRVLPRCFTEVELRMANPFRAFDFIPRRLLTYGKKGSASFEYFQNHLKELFKEIVGKGPPADDDFTIGAQLMRIRKKTGITDERILSEIGILFVEGYETTGHTISWTLFCVATNPGVQRKVAEELDAAGFLIKPGYTPREFEYPDVKKLKYLNACLKESMRMYPVVSVGNGRMTDKPTMVGPYRLPAGILVGVPLYALHNTVHNWQGPSTFRPERWMEVPMETFVYSSTDPNAERGGSTTYMPFSEGPRNCVGQSLAKMEVMVVLAKLLSSFEFTLAPEMGGVAGVTNRESTHLTLQTKGTAGIRMLLRSRNRD